MAGVLKVLAPYVTLRVTDDAGAPVVKGFYEGALVPVSQVDPESLDHHVRVGMAEVVGADPQDGESQGKPAASRSAPKPAAAKAPSPSAPQGA
jgi:hypothetical protein